MMKIQYFGVKTKLIQENQQLFPIFLESITLSDIPTIRERDIIAISSKIVAMEQGRLVDLTDYQPSSRAYKLSALTELSPSFVELVLEEADEIIGTVKGALLTLRRNILQANAGVDKSNAGKNKAILLPTNSDRYAAKFKSQLEQHYNISKIGVIIVDSAVRSLRRGTIGLSIGHSGFPASIDERGHVDLFGQPMQITFRAIADNLASACNLLMGESSESRPFVVIRGLNDIFKNWDGVKEADPIILPKNCLIFSNIEIHRF